MTISFWIILTASLVAILNALVGSFLVVRKKAMMGDAISHAVLPGIVLAYLISGSVDSLPVLLGAAATGVLVTLMIEFLQERLQLQSDASIGISYTFFFAVGVLMVVAFAQGGDVDLDQECVLYGEVSLVPLDTVHFLGMVLPKQVLILSATFTVVLLCIAVTYNRLMLTSFDEAYASSLGISVVFWRYFLMSLVSVVTVISFESVGVILVIAFLVGPVAMAYLLTGRFLPMLLLSMVFGVAASVIGYFVADAMDGSVAGAVATVIGVLFLLVFLFQWIRKRQIGRRIAQGS
jgi:manganese/zinc/iron transport system permease protein